MVERESTLSHPEQEMLAIARGAKTRQANRQAADSANDALDERLNPSISLYKETHDDQGYKRFEAEASDRSEKANSLGHFWSGPEKYVPTDNAGNMIHPETSGEHQAKEATKTEGRMMAQTQGHVDAIEYIRSHITQDVFDQRMADELNDSSIKEKDRLKPEDFETIQKDPENDLVYNHFRKNDEDIFYKAWGATSEQFATDLGTAMIPGMTHDSKDHAKFDDTVQTKAELPAFMKAAEGTQKAVDETARLNRNAALSDRQFHLEKSERGGDRYDAAVARNQMAINLSEGAKTYRDGAEAQVFDKEAYQAAMRPQAELDEMDKQNVWDKRTDEQKQIAADFEKSSHEGTDNMSLGQGLTLSALEELKKKK